ncbi:MAG: leucine-rich repeat protein [Acutalibacteraceae bacterium]|nr:leucine-rich repeat protein [Acutalibacteraceae bacterium]
MSVNEKMTAIADAIRDKTKETEALSLDDMATEVSKVFDVGKKAEYDTLWDNLQNYGNRKHYAYAFAYTGWNDNNYNPKYPIVPKSTTGVGNIFTWNQGISNIKVPITFYGAGNNAFYSCVQLKKIPKLIFSAATNISNAFYNCTALEEMYCEGTLDITGLDLHWSTKLNKASIESVINTLSATTSGLTVTLSQTAVNNAFTTEEWEALEATKPNWTISLV